MIDGEDDGFLGKARREARIACGTDLRRASGKLEAEHHATRALAAAAVSIAESLDSIAGSLAVLATPPSERRN